MSENSLINSVIKNIFKDSLLYVPGQLIPAIFGFISLAIYTHIFSPSDYGDYSLTMATISILGIITYSWINSSNLRFFTIYMKNNKLYEFFTTSFISLFTCLMISLLILIFLNLSSLITSNISNNILLSIGVLSTLSLFETNMTILRVQRKPFFISAFRILSSILNFTLSLTLIYIFKFDISALLLSLTLINLFLDLILVYKFGYYKYFRLKYFSKSTTMEFIRYGVPLICTLLFSWILVVSNRFIIDYYRGSYEVGLYTASYQLADYPITFLSSMILLASFPIIINVWEKNGDTFTSDLISKIIKYYLIFTLPILLCITMMSKEIMVILGVSYTEGYKILPLITFGGLIMGLCNYTNKGLELKKNTKLLAILIGFAAISNVILNLLLVPIYGFYGAGIALGITYTIYFFISFIISNNYLKIIFPKKSIKNILLSLIPMGILIIAFKAFSFSILYLIAIIMIGFVIYIALLFFFGEIKEEMKEISIKIININ